MWTLQMKITATLAGTANKLECYLVCKETCRCSSHTTNHRAHLGFPLSFAHFRNTGSSPHPSTLLLLQRSVPSLSSVVRRMSTSVALKRALLARPMADADSTRAGVMGITVPELLPACVHKILLTLHYRANALLYNLK